MCESNNESACRHAAEAPEPPIVSGNQACPSQAEGKSPFNLTGYYTPVQAILSSLLADVLVQLPAAQPALFSLHMTGIARRVAAVFAKILRLLLLALLLMGCARVSSTPILGEACRFAGGCDLPAPTPLFIDVLCDRSTGSSCTASVLGQALERTLQHVAPRPGSHVRVWMLGATVAETAVFSDQIVPSLPDRGSERSQRQRIEHFVTTERDRFLAAARPLFAAPPVRRSPLAESLSKIALAEVGGLVRNIVVIGDAREVSGVADMECAPNLGSDAQFLARARRRGALAQGRFNHITVAFSYVEVNPVARRDCPVRIDREQRIRDLWTSSIRAAGGRAVLSSGPPTFDFPTTNTNP